MTCRDRDIPPPERGSFVNGNQESQKAQDRQPRNQEFRIPQIPQGFERRQALRAQRDRKKASAEEVEQREFNEETTRVLLESKAGKNLTRCENLDELFEDLGI
jgi:hypothetical protein